MFLSFSQIWEIQLKVCKDLLGKSDKTTDHHKLRIQILDYTGTLK
jgi:hypothetical protein